MSTNYRLISHSYCSATAQNPFNNAFSKLHPSPINEYSSSSSSSSYAYQQSSPSDSNSLFYPTSHVQKNTSPHTYIKLSEVPTPWSEVSPFTCTELNPGCNAGASQFNGAHSSDAFQCRSEFNTNGSESFDGSTDSFCSSSDLGAGNSQSDSSSITMDLNPGTSSADSSPSPTGTITRTRTTGGLSRCNVAHPYARLVAKKDDKRRKTWNHDLEESVFTPFEMFVFFVTPALLFIFFKNLIHRSTLGAQLRRGTYIRSLEAHIDTLHAQLLEYV